MNAPLDVRLEPRVRAMTELDFESVSRIYVAHVGARPPADWRDGLRRCVDGEGALGAALVTVLPDGEVVGYAVGEVRSWEFGSPPAGWITGLGVAPSQQRRGIGRGLLSALVAHLKHAGVTSVRSMAKRDDVVVLRLFRNAGFAGGPYVELELAGEA